MHLKAIRVISEQVSPQQFLRLSSIEKANIAESRIIPPKLGENEFGKIEISYKDPFYKVEINE